MEAAAKGEERVRLLEGRVDPDELLHGQPVVGVVLEEPEVEGRRLLGVAHLGEGRLRGLVAHAPRHLRIQR